MVKKLVKHEKLDHVTRDGLFVGYKVDSSGQWTRQVLVLDREDFEQQKRGVNRHAAVHPDDSVPAHGGDQDDFMPAFYIHPIKTQVANSRKEATLRNWISSN